MLIMKISENSRNEEKNIFLNRNKKMKKKLHNQKNNFYLCIEFRKVQTIIELRFMGEEMVFTIGQPLAQRLSLQSSIESCSAYCMFKYDT